MALHERVHGVVPLGHVEDDAHALGREAVRAEDHLGVVQDPALGPVRPNDAELAADRLPGRSTAIWSRCAGWSSGWIMSRPKPKVISEEGSSRGCGRGRGRLEPL